MICQAFEDILEGVEFERSKAAFCKPQCLKRISAAAVEGVSYVTYQLVADLLRC